MSDYGGYYTESKFLKKCSECFKQAGEKLIWHALILQACAVSKTIPISAAYVCIGALGYFIFPCDAIPDTIPVIGFTDDLGIILAAFASIKEHITSEIYESAHSSMKHYFNDFKKGNVL